jgi:hypothetical protein
VPTAIVGSVRATARSVNSIVHTHGDTATGSEVLVPEPSPSESKEETGAQEQTGGEGQPAKASSTSRATIQLPSKAEVSIPVATIPGTPATMYSVDLTSPVAAYTTTRNTYETANALVTSAVQPYNPLDNLKPKPEPQPAMKVYETQELGPAIVDVGDPSNAGAAGMEDFSVVHIPLVVSAAARLAPPRPYSETSPPGAGAAGGNGTPGARGSEAQTGTQGAEPPLNGATSPVANSSLRQGFPQYLRNARTVELATMALPGVAGLLAITAGGSVIGYRQANSGRYLRADSARFLT